MAAPNATTRPILDFSTQPRLGSGGSRKRDRGIKVNADWARCGLRGQQANDNGIHIQGANNVVENCVVHDNDDTGVQIGINTRRRPGPAASTTPSGTATRTTTTTRASDGENADGFGAKEASGPATSSSAAEPGRTPTTATTSMRGPARQAEDCWASRSARNSSFTGPDSDGNGFKLGGDDMGGNHQLMNCSAWDNKARGYTNNSGANSSCTGCTSCANGTSGDQGVSGITGGGCPTATDAPQHDGTIP